MCLQYTALSMLLSIYSVHYFNQVSFVEGEKFAAKFREIRQRPVLQTSRGLGKILAIKFQLSHRLPFPPSLK